MDDKDTKLRGKLEDLFSDLSDSFQAEPSPDAPLKGTPGRPPEADRPPIAQPVAALRTLAGNTTDAILLSDLAGRVTFSNRACCDLLGYDYTHNEMVGLETAALWSDEERERLTGEILPLALAGEWHGQAMQRRKDGSLLRASLTLFPVPDEQKQPIAVASIIRDLTEHKQAEEALAQERGLLRTLIDTMPDLIYIKDRQSRFVVVNQAQVRLLGGTTPDDLLGKTDFDFFPHELAQKYYADEQAILQSGQPRISLEEPTVDTAGNKKWITTTKVPLRDSHGQVTGFVGVGRDITERKQAEAERERLLANAEHRALQLQTITEVSRAISSLVTLDELLPQMVELIRDRFNLYYVGIFLVNEADRYAVLRAGTGEAGRKMLEAGHKLEVGGASMIGWCIANQRARIVLDVGKEATRFSNPLLPMTHSEMALPLISRDHVIGAMTIQSDQPTAFTQEDVTVLQSMTDQTANAIENAQLFEVTQRRATREQLVNRMTAHFARSLDIDTVLQTVVRELGESLSAREVSVLVGSPAASSPVQTGED